MKKYINKVCVFKLYADLQTSSQRVHTQEHDVKGKELESHGRPHEAYDRLNTFSVGDRDNTPLSRRYQRDSSYNPVRNRTHSHRREVSEKSQSSLQTTKSRKKSHMSSRR